MPLRKWNNRQNVKFFGLYLTRPFLISLLVLSDFFCLQDNFSQMGFALVKMVVMMIGEYDFDSLFFSAEEDVGYIVPYPTFTLLFFLVFLVIMSIIVMNLLVGLAVDDIKAVQNSAVLQRLAMQVTLNLEVEKMLPDFMRRRVLVKQETLFPNKKKSIFSKVLNDDNT